jgi:polyisoprenoid-binding protein YceI
MIGISRTALRAGSLLAMIFGIAAILGTDAGLAAAPAPAATAAPHYTVDVTRSRLRFQFVQAGATNSGRFSKFTADVVFSPDKLAGNKIDATVDVTSLDTGDQERDDTLKGADLFNIAKFPQARFVATRFVSTAAQRYEAQGKLTIRNVTKDVRMPISFVAKTEQGKNVAYLTGRAAIKRLEYGVGQGEWKSTEWVADDVNVDFSLKLVPAT